MSSSSTGGRCRSCPARGGGAVRWRCTTRPGHTEGSVVFHLPGAVDDADGDGDGLLLSGDLLFAGSIGRCDLLGGDPRPCSDSLLEVLPRFGDDVVVLPGHGPSTTMARERASNPYLRQLSGGTWLMARIAPLSGFPEWLPADRAVELHVLDTLRDTFELHGFAPVETRSVEPLSQLLRKGEIDKEVYVVRRLHAEDATGPTSTPTRSGLHFDLTVPFARYVLQHGGHLGFPFKRYQIQRSWRGERPQDGRFREFVQADVDVVGVDTLPRHYEVDLPLVMVEALRRARRRRASGCVSTTGASSRPWCWGSGWPTSRRCWPPSTSSPRSVRPPSGTLLRERAGATAAPGGRRPRRWPR